MPDNTVDKPIEDFEQAGEAIQVLADRVVGLELKAAKKGKVIFPRAWFPPASPPSPADRAEAEESTKEA